MRLDQDLDTDSAAASVSGPAATGIKCLNLILRFRCVVIVVIAVNRLSHCQSTSRQLFTTHVEFPTGSAKIPVVIGTNGMFPTVGCKTSANQTTVNQMTTWLPGCEVHKVVVDVLADFYQVIKDHSNGEIGNGDWSHISRVAQQCFDKLVARLSTVYGQQTSGHGVQHNRFMANANSDDRLLVNDLKRGLYQVINKRSNISRHRIILYTTCQELLDELRTCILDFTNRLHSTEVDRRNLLIQLTQPLISESKTPGGAVEHDGYVEQLLNQISQLEEERSSLKDNVRDAEAALRTVTRDKQSLASYVAAVEKVLGPWDGTDASDWPPECLLPAQLGDVSTNHRHSANLTAVRALVMSFILAHNRLVCRLAACREQFNQLQRQSNRLKLELDAVTCKQLSAEQGSFVEDVVKQSTVSVTVDSRLKHGSIIPGNSDSDAASRSDYNKKPQKQTKHCTAVSSRPTDSTVETQETQLTTARKSRLARYNKNHRSQQQTVRRPQVVMATTSVYRH
jgi:hypothetical protein